MIQLEQNRLQQLERNIPLIWEYDSLLYIGAGPERFHFKKQLKAISKGCEIDVLEIEPDRCKALWPYKWIRRIIQDDVVNAAHCIEQRYDCILWSHGPEILENRTIAFETLEYLYKMTKEVLVVLCPWGEYKYDADEINSHRPSDINKTALYPDDFLVRGFAVSCLGFKDMRGSNLLAWRYEQVN